MAQHVSALAALPEDPGLALKTHVAAHKYGLQGIQNPLLAPEAPDIHTIKTPIHNRKSF